MNVLFISDVFPRFHAPGGSPTRVYCLIRELAKNHQITLLSTRWPNVDINESELEGLCKVEFYQFCERKSVNNGWLAKTLGRKNFHRFLELKHLLFEYPMYVQSTLRHLDNFRAKLLDIGLEKFDIVQIEVSNIAYRAKEIRNICPKIPILLDFHDVNSYVEYRKYKNAQSLGWRIFSYFEWKKMIRYEKKVSSLFDRCLTVSQDDKDLLLSIAPNANVSVIANGVDTDFFKNENPNSYESKSIFFVGSDWPPNEDAILFFNNKILPLIIREIPDVKFYIIGGLGKNDKIKSLANDNVIITGYVDDVRKWMERCAVCVVPMRLGGGTKLKTLEALSMGKAIVSTKEGCEGINVTHGENILIANNPNEFSNFVINLLQNRSLCDRLGNNGRKLAQDVYDWKAIGRRLNEIYLDTVKQ